MVAGASDGEWVVRYAVAMGLEALVRRMEPLPEEHQRALEALDTEGRRGPPGPRDRQAPHLREVAWQWPGAWWATTDD